MLLPALSHRAFGRHTLVTLGTYDTHVSFVAEQAGYVHQIKLAGRNLLWNYADGAALDDNDGYRGLALVPFPNRLLEGDYSWGQRDLQFEVNMPDTRSALHGFGLQAHFATERISLDAESAEVRLSYLHVPGSQAANYPFLVRFALDLAVDIRAATATWQLSATNLGDDPAPVGLGWHPYFALPGGAQAWRLAMPPNEQVVLEEAIPTGARAAGLPPKQGVPIDPSWDDCFALTDGRRRTVTLVGPDYGLRLAQRGHTRFTQLYVPPGAPAVAVEPMSCNVNAFRDDQAEVSLAAGEQRSIGMSVALI